MLNEAEIKRRVDKVRALCEEVQDRIPKGATFTPDNSDSVFYVKIVSSVIVTGVGITAIINGGGELGANWMRYLNAAYKKLLSYKSDIVTGNT